MTTVSPQINIQMLKMPAIGTQIDKTDLEPDLIKLASNNQLDELMQPNANMDGAKELTPEQEASDSGQQDVWQQNKRIVALWTINQNRNAWIGTDGTWKKLANNSDSAIVALMLLSSHAREKGSVVNYREESDAMVHELYVW